MDTETVKKAIKEIVLRHQPDAEVILYGSRARGDAEADSDWNVLVLLPCEVSPNWVRNIRHDVYDWEVNNDEVVTVMVREKDSWDSSLMRATPFHENVTSDGCRL